MVTISGLKEGDYAVRLTFCEPDTSVGKGQRVFSVAIGSEVTSEKFDPFDESGGSLKSLVIERESIEIGEEGSIRFNLKAESGKPILSGIELIRSGLQTSDPAPR